MNDQYYTADPSSESKPVPCAFPYRGHGLNFMTDAGVFSKGELDQGTRLLLDALPELVSRYGTLARIGVGTVTDAAEVIELGGPIGAAAGSVEGAADQPAAAHDGLTVEDLLLLDALPLRRGSPVEKLASVAGLSVPAVRAGLARLELEDLAVRDGPQLWKRSRQSPV